MYYVFPDPQSQSRVPLLDFWGTIQMTFPKFLRPLKMTDFTSHLSNFSRCHPGTCWHLVVFIETIETIMIDLEIAYAHRSRSFHS